MAGCRCRPCGGCCSGGCCGRHCRRHRRPPQTHIQQSGIGPHSDHPVAAQLCPALQAATPSHRSHAQKWQLVAKIRQIHHPATDIDATIATGTIQHTSDIERCCRIAKPGTCTRAYLVAIDLQAKINARQVQVQLQCWGQHPQAGLRQLQLPQMRQCLQRVTAGLLAG